VALTITVDGTDVTSLVRLDQITFEMKAYGGEVGAGRLVFDDTTGTATPASAMKEWVATESLASPTTIAGGYIAERDIFRGPLRASTMRQFGPVLEDYNAALADRLLQGSNARRPEETDYQRITWLLGTGALGHLDGAGHVPNTDTVQMEPANYRGKYALDVLQECAEASNKNHFVYWKQGTGWVLFYDKANATNSAFTSTLQISDLLSDIDNTTTFGASDIDYQRDPVSIFSSMVVRWKSGWVRETDDATVDDFRRRDIFRRRTRCRTASAARRWARKQLEKTDEETQRLSLTVTIPPDKLGNIRAGQRIQVKLRHVGITSYTYFRIVAVAISPKIGQGGNATDVLYSVRLTMRDKERLLGGGVGGGTRVGSGGNSGITGPPGAGGSGAGDGGNDGGDEPDDDPSPPGGGIESGEHILDDWTRSPSDHPTELAFAETTSTAVTHAIELPEGCDVPGNLLLLVYTSSNDDAVGAYLSQLVADGWTTITSFNSHGSTSGGLVWRVIDGTEGYAGTGDVVNVTGTSGTETLVARVALVSGHAAEVTANLNLDHITPSVSGWAGEDELGYVFGFDNVTVAGSPPSYPIVGNLSLTGAALRVGRNDFSNGAFNPGDWTASGSGAQASATLAIRYADPEWGTIPRGEGVTTDAPWTGGNRYIKIMSGTADVSTDGTHGLIAMTAANTTVAMVLKSDAADDPSDQPWGPWAEGDAALRYLWKVNPVGNLADTDENILEWQLITGGWRGTFRVNLGDGATYVYQSGGDERGIVIGQNNTVEWSPFVQKTIASDTYYMTRIDFRGTRARMKLWAASLTEPIDWDIDVAKSDDDLDPALDVAQLWLRAYGNNGMTFTFDTSWATVGGDASGPTQENLPNGDGVTTTWTILPWVGTLIVYVDGLVTTLASFDRAAGTFTFDRAPAFGAYISVSYVQS
jgi:hypothetical protein